MHTYNTIPWVLVDSVVDSECGEQYTATIRKVHTMGSKLKILINDWRETPYGGYVVEVFKDEENILSFEVNAFEQDKLVNIINTLLLAN